MILEIIFLGQRLLFESGWGIGRAQMTVGMVIILLYLSSLQRHPKFIAAREAEFLLSMNGYKKSTSPRLPLKQLCFWVENIVGGKPSYSAYGLCIFGRATGTRRELCSDFWGLDSWVRRWRMRRWRWHGRREGRARGRVPRLLIEASNTSKPRPEHDIFKASSTTNTFLMRV